MFAGIGLHILVALFFAIHAVRTGQGIYWLFILFSFPGLGSLVYFIAIYIPQVRNEYGTQKVLRAAKRAFTPGDHDLAQARKAYDHSPTAQNHMRLAEALMNHGDAAAAAATYEACLHGPFAKDLDIHYGAARAFAASHQPEQAIGHANFIREHDKRYKPEQVTLMLAKAHAATGRHEAARKEFEAAVAMARSFESRAEMAIWASKHAEPELTRKLYLELLQERQHWTKFTAETHAELVTRLDAACGHHQ